MEGEASGADKEVEEQAHRERLLRREWAGKTKAAEWALKAHRDKQVSQRDLCSATHNR